MELLKHAGRLALKALGVGSACLLIAWWFLMSLSSCVVMNPCPGYVDDYIAATNRGDYEAADDALDKFVEAECEVED